MLTPRLLDKGTRRGPPGDNFAGIALKLQRSACFHTPSSPLIFCCFKVKGIFEEAQVSNALGLVLRTIQRPHRPCNAHAALTKILPTDENIAESISVDIGPTEVVSIAAAISVFGTRDICKTLRRTEERRKVIATVESVVKNLARPLSPKNP